MAQRHHEARARGLAAEWIAALWLMAKGYRIVARGYRVTGGELDIVALSPFWRPRMLIFVEVRARGSAQMAAESVTQAKQERVAWAASHFCARRRNLAQLPRRFDLILLAPGRWPQHVAGAWTVPSR
jgi:putative endonuclease